jgi:hypothetical protein
MWKRSLKYTSTVSGRKPGASCDRKTRDPHLPNKNFAGQDRSFAIKNQLWEWQWRLLLDTRAGLFWVIVSNGLGFIFLSKNKENTAMSTEAFLITAFIFFLWLELLEKKFINTITKEIFVLVFVNFSCWAFLFFFLFKFYWILC